MRIGEFVSTLKTTKDTVRHYEELKLLKPKWKNHRKDYTEKEIQDFNTIMELKSLGLTLCDIQFIFNLKETLGCGNPKLIQEVYEQLNQHLEKLLEEEKQLQMRINSLKEVISKFKDYVT